jgi:Protein of unknown function (DUF2934)
VGRISRTDEIVKMLSLVKAELPPWSDPGLTDVARRAYEIFESRGRIDGADVDDWLQAELESQTVAS